jgi:hypothetical protein
MLKEWQVYINTKLRAMGIPKHAIICVIRGYLPSGNTIFYNDPKYYHHLILSLGYYATRYYDPNPRASIISLFVSSSDLGHSFDRLISQQLNPHSNLLSICPLASHRNPTYHLLLASQNLNPRAILGRS